MVEPQSWKLIMGVQVSLAPSLNNIINYTFIFGAINMITIILNIEIRPMKYFIYK